LYLFCNPNFTHILNCVWWSDQAEPLTMVSSYNVVVTAWQVPVAELSYSTLHNVWCRKSVHYLCWMNTWWLLPVVLRMRCTEFGRKQTRSNFNVHVTEWKWITFVMQYAESDYNFNVTQDW